MLRQHDQAHELLTVRLQMIEVGFDGLRHSLPVTRSDRLLATGVADSFPNFAELRSVCARVANGFGGRRCS